MDVLKIQGLSKSFKCVKVLDNLNMTVSEGSVFGFIGKNGSGKTTTMKHVLGFLKADEGEISVFGEKVRFGNYSMNRFIGYLPDVPEFYGYMTPKEYLRLCGEISGVEVDKISPRITELLSLVGLDGANSKRKVKGFSRGMKQRLGIASALFNKPKLLICDEPTSALDPTGRKEILDILHSVKKETTIIFSTHILSDVERICDNIGILNNGKIILEGEISAIKNTYRSDKILLELNNSDKILPLTNKLNSFGEIINIASIGNTITLTTKDVSLSGKKIISLLSETDIGISKYEVLEPDLEQLFLEVTK